MKFILIFILSLMLSYFMFSLILSNINWIYEASYLQKILYLIQTIGWIALIRAIYNSLNDDNNGPFLL